MVDIFLKEVSNIAKSWTRLIRVHDLLFKMSGLLHFLIRGIFICIIDRSNLFLNFVLDTLMSDVYNQRKDQDGFLYITYTDETTLGN